MSTKYNLVRLGVFIAVFFALYVVFIKPYYGLRINVTPSLPQTLFVSYPLQEIRRSAYVSFRRPDSPLPLVKEIRGLPGEHIDVQDKRVFVAGQDCGVALRISKTGRIYHTIQHHIIPDGYVYVYSSHPESFDSRYEEFGLVRIEDLKEELCPLF